MPETTLHLAFSRCLKFWRGVHKLSQEQLAQRINSSPRHISRLENGISRPSENMVLDITQALGLRQHDSNHLRIAAGFTPREHELDIHSPQLRWLRKAMMMNLKALDPYPSVIMDRASNIVMVNRGWVSFFRSSIPQQQVDQAKNYYDFLFSHKAAGMLLGDWENTVSVILMSLQQEALLSNSPEDQALVNKLQSHAGVPDDWQQRASEIEPMSSFKMQIDVEGKPQVFFNVSSSIGERGATAYSSRAQLVIDTLYPEDETMNLSKWIVDDIKHPLLYY